MEERPFSVALLFGLVWIALAYLGDFVVLPVWNNLNTGLCFLGLFVCVANYFNEYRGIFPLSYSKFAPDGVINARFGWTMCYGIPATVYIVLWYLSGMPQSTFHLVTLITYLGHFVKRVLEALFLHKYSKKISILPATEIAMFYSLGSVVQHYWCNLYTQGPLADKLSSNHIAFTVGIMLYITGELINLYHHVILANLRPAGTSSGYVIPQAGLFPYIVCPHYFGELIAWYGMAVAGQHLCVYLAWLSMLCYLSGRSHQTQVWYQKKIENFPKDRRNLFPGIY
ncbi:hypothetical protein OS493_037502 [Desmophyllum pertusum]|uniref:3-oxo-5-alpha-steroid 4-dehydrogenase C-terminal domain-containing protein n=1 Tax=Desmophyllum pertusum TaxID=174260 RepID=A0A9W9YL41_9CNID|nr:hypothetical protein OS493_037502 [Desmophyllum pertusum]